MRVVLTEFAKRHFDTKFIHWQRPDRRRILSILKGRVRFQNTKSDRIIQVWHLYRNEKFWNGLQFAYSTLSILANKGSYLKHLKEVRGWLVREVKGMGEKTAIQFLRNIGMRGLAILDVHILSHMYERGLVPQNGLTKDYGEVEYILMEYAESMGLYIDELDLLWWSNKTGFVLRSTTQ